MVRLLGRLKKHGFTRAHMPGNGNPPDHASYSHPQGSEHLTGPWKPIRYQTEKLPAKEVFSLRCGCWLYAGIYHRAIIVVSTSRERPLAQTCPWPGGENFKSLPFRAF